MSDDLVKRLREDQPVTQDMESTLQCALQDEAADCIKELEAAIDWQIGRAEAAEAKLDRAMEALTPSTQTKAKFMGEFDVPLSMATDWGEETRLIPVPWTTVKEIMKAIRDFAEQEGQDDD